MARERPDFPGRKHQASGPKLGVVFDLDDTLLYTSQVYYKKLANLVYRTIYDCAPEPVSPEHVMEVFHTIERGQVSDDAGAWYAAVKESSFEDDPLSFASCCCKTYIECLMQSSKVPDDTRAKRVFNDSAGILKAHYRMESYATGLINRLAHRRNFTLFVVTSGSRELQLSKMDRYKVFLAFEKIIVVPLGETKVTALKELQEDYDDIDMWFMVGDSINGDINAALAAGMYAVRVKRLASEFSDGELVALPAALRRYRELANLSQVEKFLNGVASAKIQV